MLTIYKASAGSGKTFALAKEYITMLLGQKDNTSGRYSLRKPGSRAHRSILAITFTTAATAEMKRRIIEHLEQLAGKTDQKCGYMDELVNLFHTTGQQLAQAADTALRDLLMDFNQFNVSTIDAFFQMVLRTFAREIDLPGNYQVELDEKRVTAIGIGEMLNSLNHDETADGDKARRLSHWLSQFMTQSINDSRGFNLFNRQGYLHQGLVATMGKLHDENFKANREKVMEYLQDPTGPLESFESALAGGIAISKRQSVKSAADLLNAITDAGLNPDTDINRYLLDFLRKSASAWNGKMNATVAGAVTDPQKRYKAARVKAGIPAGLDGIMAASLAEQAGQRSRVATSRLLLSNLYNFGLLGHLLDFIREYGRQNDMIMLSDTNEMLQRIISEEETPFIYERMGVYLRHYLIDEFQDTSRMQWLNMEPLLHESLSEDNDNLIIGDEKQCIYRFRNSNPELLGHEVKKVMTARAGTRVNERGTNVKENTNWRSARDVVEFNNSLFTRLACLAGISDEYANVVQQVSAKHASLRGYVSLASIDAEGDEYTAATLRRMAAEIKRQLSAGYRPGDIAVIVRRNNEGEKVVNYLLDLMGTTDDDGTAYPSFQITSSDSVSVGSSPVIKLVLSVLRFIDSPEVAASGRGKNPREVARMINRFEYYTTKERLDASTALQRAISDASGADSIDALAADAADMKCISLTSLVERVIGRFVPESDLTAQNLFLTAFQDIVTEYCDRGQGDVHSFLSWWEETGHSRKIDTPPDRDSLIVTTVHKSKGLQYPCVHLPFANWELTEYSSATKLIFEWFDMAPVKRLGLAADGLIPPVMPIKLEKAIADSPLSDQLQAIFKKQKIDNINLLYVAMTRAENELIVSTNAYTPSTKGDDGALKAEKLTRILNLAISSGAGQIAGLDTYGDISDYTLPLEQAYDSAAATLTVGRPTKPDTLREDEDEAQQMPPYFTSDSQNIWDDTCIDDAIDPYRSRDRGILLHDVLSRVRHAGDLDLALRRRAYRLGLTAAETSMARQALGQALGQPDARRWFEDFARVLNERTITLDDGSRYRPDRVVWTADGTIEVVDYKFGKERAARYARQVNRYAGFLREIYPGTTVKGYVWYPESGHIVATDSATAST